MALNYLANIGRFIPELLACVTMLGLILIEATYGERDKDKKILSAASDLGLVMVLGSLIVQFNDTPTAIFSNAVVIDPFSTFMKIIMTLGTLGAVYLNGQSRDVHQGVKAEYNILALGVLVGAMLLASANNMLILYIGIEILSILSYVMASLNKIDDRSSEAGLKYVLYGGVSAGIMLFGISHIFGVLGTIQFTGMGALLQSLSDSQVAIIIPSFLLFFAGIGYKIACVPFHMWSPDVYEGSPLPVTTFFAIVPKLAGMALIVRISFVFFSHDGLLSQSWLGLLVIVSALTMTVGNVSALKQKSIKRMLAYSSISHAGFMLAGAVVVDSVGVRAIAFYGVTYLFMTLAAFYIVSFVQDKYGNDHFERFNGLMYRYPLMAVLMCLVMFSLAGVPPLAGFVAKFNILSALIGHGNYTLAIVAGLNSVVSLYYYLKIVRLMVFKDAESNEKIEGFGFVNQGIIAALSLPILVLGIFWNQIFQVVDKAVLFIQ
ncbi:MAG: NADH-quinone oxidoreductase subunit N [Halobacteriovoraceae bacterium]|jgi:NADH-quinone oxidoreductase subunit N|nr:NADH-quinone oxidoreductase subunit N [Halobacteriovoraceae bacterium]MBT5093121.1 NADH-quinone oxidoreductase subunit N [Halobacteriovoraceae bacterium]